MLTSNNVVQEVLQIRKAMHELLDSMDAEAQQRADDNDKLDNLLQQPELTLRLALGAASSAQRAIKADQPDLAVMLQDQARLWMELSGRISAVVRQAQWDKEESELLQPNTVPVPAEDATVK